MSDNSESEVMKFKLKDIEPNPFRRMDNYPIHRDKIEALRASIEQTTFWDNIVGRKVGHKAQIAYGHHRLVTLREIMEPDDKVELIIRDLSNAQMLQIMANENMEEWGSSARVVQETVRAVVDAYATGEINLQKPIAAERGGRVRYAPSFAIGRSEDPSDRPYTAETVGTFLGWTYKDGAPRQRIHAALAELEAEELGIISATDRERLEQTRRPSEDVGTVVNTGRRVYEATKRNTGDEKKARDKARKVVKKLTQLAEDRELTPDRAAREGRKEITNGKQGPPPHIDEVMVRMMRKLNTFLSDRDSDWSWVEELFKFLPHTGADDRKHLRKCIVRLAGVMEMLTDALDRAGDAEGEIKFVHTAGERKLLEASDA